MKVVQRVESSVESWADDLAWRLAALRDQSRAAWLAVTLAEAMVDVKVDSMAERSAASKVETLAVPTVAEWAAQKAEQKDG